MPTTQFKCSLVLTLSALFSAWIVLSQHLEAEERRLTSQHHGVRGTRLSVWRAEETEQRSRFKLELDALKVAGEKDERERQSRFSTELDQVFGGRVERALKNPDLDIAGMLRATTLACLPPGTEVEVTTDRFTEFAVRITLRERTGKAELAKMLGEFLGRCSAYVNSVRLKTPTNAEITIGRATIERVENWENDGLKVLNSLMQVL